MTVRLTMFCATTAEGGLGRVFGDGAVSDRRRRELAAMTATLPPYALALRGPSARCAQTAEALAIAATPEHALRDLDHGRWDARTPEDIAAVDPHGLSVWLTDPDAAPHGGETVRELCRRTAAWLDTLPAGTGRILAITEASFIRAALVHALSVPARSFGHLQVPPASTVTLTLRDGCWSTRFDRLTVPRRRQTAEGVPTVAVPTTPTTRRRVCLTGRP
ncbi:histidine phosphatase family protein [Streptomyces sp. NRRL WC-3744]|uniref:histidine phosphatase family protein n=1 Tax=Streptomyces sp. NRRL WC-3744 TaxID=1463935 RepID=UPI0004C6B6FF|nr:histidine phosphatase family protein [Streptomyces sp. NRRL WC-3744]